MRFFMNMSAVSRIRARYDDVPRLNLSLRTALHVLYPLKKFSCTSPQDLYREVSTVPWEEIIAPQEYLSVVALPRRAMLTTRCLSGKKLKMRLSTGLLPNAVRARFRAQ